MMMIPIQVIAFFLATLLLPAGVEQFTINVEGKTIQWTKQDTAWHAVQLPFDDGGMYSTVGNVVTVAEKGKERKTDMATFLVLPSNADQKTLSQNRTFGNRAASLGALPAPVTHDDGLKRNGQ
ncbi:MAG: hypothetical protein NTV79_09905 [Candidatus Aureabacteria bacterium]|nr:hypothetical protein [Candidatus Auribacterota bacterium]